MLISLGIFLAFILIAYDRLSILEKWSFAFILGGGFGNFFDRVLHHGVFDFLQVFLGKYPWPTFNFADAIIDIGIGLLLLDIILGGKHASNTN